MAEKKAPKKKPKAAGKDAGKIYDLKVELIGGPVSQKFLDANPVVSRTIAMRGDQTLEQLHRAIFKAFDRFDHHLYEFQFGKQPQDRDALRYVMDSDGDLHEPEPGEEAADVDPFWRRTGPRPRPASSTTLDDLGLKTRNRFFYWFDFGDDWWHVVRVAAIRREAPEGRYPRVVEKVGKSPPQYMDEEDFEDEEG